MWKIDFQPPTFTYDQKEWKITRFGKPLPMSFIDMMAKDVHSEHYYKAVLVFAPDTKSESTTTTTNVESTFVRNANGSFERLTEAQLQAIDKVHSELYTASIPIAPFGSLLMPPHKHQMSLLKVHYRRIEFGFVPGLLAKSTEHKSEGTKWMHFVGNLMHRLIQTREESDWRSWLNLSTGFMSNPLEYTTPKELRTMLKCYLWMAGPGAIDVLKRTPLPHVDDDPDADLIVNHLLTE
jgi:hypothetical protein